MSPSRRRGSDDAAMVTVLVGAGMVLLAIAGYPKRRMVTTMRVRMRAAILGTFHGIEEGVKRGDIVDIDDDEEALRASAMRVRYVAAAMGMSIAIPFMAPVPAYADEPVFSDNFATKNTTLWNWGAGASVSNNQLVLACDSNYDGQIVTPIAYNLTDSTFTAQLITPPAVGGGHTETGFIASSRATDIETNSIYMEWVGGELRATWVTGGGLGTFIYYHQGRDYFPGIWLRLRHSSATGLVYWEKSSDATTWTTFASAVPQFDITNVWLSLECGYWEPETSGPAIYDNVSLVHNAPVSPPPPPLPP
jgi:hypothetical protein